MTVTSTNLVFFEIPNFFKVIDEDTVCNLSFIKSKEDTTLYIYLDGERIETIEYKNKDQCEEAFIMAKNIVKKQITKSSGLVSAPAPAPTPEPTPAPESTISKAPTKMSQEHTKRFQDKLTKYYFTDEELVLFNTLLKETGAIVAGGSVAHSITGDNIIKWYQYTMDIDIYVNVRYFTTVKNFFKTHGYINGSRTNRSSPYDQSFMAKNGIQKRWNVTNKDNDTKWISDSNSPSTQVDLMKIANRIKTTDVASNFDLTFCEAWYDGENIYAMYPNDIINKKGLVKPDYVASYAFGNEFLVARAHKYMSRGFTIGLAASSENIIIHNPRMGIKIKDDPEKQKKWLIRTLLMIILNIPLSIDMFAGTENMISHSSNDVDNDDDIDTDDYTTIAHLKVLAESSLAKVNWEKSIKYLTNILENLWRINGKNRSLGKIWYIKLIERELDIVVKNPKDEPRKLPLVLEQFLELEPETKMSYNDAFNRIKLYLNNRNMITGDTFNLDNKLKLLFNKGPHLKKLKVKDLEYYYDRLLLLNPASP